MRRLFDAIRRPVAIIRITPSMKADLRWWDTFLKTWNGLKLIRHDHSRPIWHIWTDASGSLGLGGFILQHPNQLHSVQEAFSTRIATRHRHKDIQFKEMKAVLYAIRLWLPRLRGARLILHCDNNACIYGLRKLSIRGPAMAPLRDIAIILASSDVILTPSWISTKENDLADGLSRFRFEKIANEYSQLRILATSPPAKGKTHPIFGTSRPHGPERQRDFFGGG